MLNVDANLAVDCRRNGDALALRLTVEASTESVSEWSSAAGSLLSESKPNADWAESGYCTKLF